MAARRKPTLKQDNLISPTPALEWIAAFCGLAASLGAIGYLTWEGLQPHSGPPALAARADSVTATPSGYVVTIKVDNRSRTTASAVVVEGALDNGSETSSLTFDYVPGMGSRDGSMTFRKDPRAAGLAVSVKGQVTP
jgi:uncharacterized protein (TIGR02588 family)